MQYNVYGKVYKRVYGGTRSHIYIENFLSPMQGLPILNLEDYSNSNELFEVVAGCKIGNRLNYHRYDSFDEKRRKIMELRDNLILVGLDEEKYKSEVFDSYKIIKTIESDKEFKDEDIFTYNNINYEVICKCNSETNKHELYIDYTCEIIIDYEVENKINNLVKETNELIVKHNSNIQKQIKELQEEPEIIHKKIPIPIEEKSWFTKLINKIKDVK
jgi:hypothetical protein